MRIGLPLTGLFIGAGLAAGGYFVSDTMLKPRVSVNTATVKGLSERIVPSDHAYMTLNFRIDVAPGQSVADVFAVAETQREDVTAALTGNGVLPAEIAHRPLRVDTQVEHDRDGIVVRRQDFVLAASTVATKDPRKLDATLGPLLGLATKGIRVRIDGPFYAFTGLNEIKPDMLREATGNARIAANEFAADAGVQVGGIQLATQGGFQVRPLPARPGIVDAGQHEVRVVTTITFYLEN